MIFQDWIKKKQKTWTDQLLLTKLNQSSKWLSDDGDGDDDDSSNNNSTKR